MEGGQAWLEFVSIQEFQDAGESCERPIHAESSCAASAEQNLFSAFEEETTVHAQDPVTVDLTRPPVRDILDTAPIFSSVRPV